MNIKTIALLGLTLAALPAHSQTTPTATPPQLSQWAQRLPVLKNAAVLGLTPQQISSINALLQDAWNTEQTIKSNASLTPAELHEQTAANRKAARREIRNILTPAQRQQLRALLHGGAQPPSTAVPTPTPTP